MGAYSVDSAKCPADVSVCCMMVKAGFLPEGHSFPNPNWSNDLCEEAVLLPSILFALKKLWFGTLRPGCHLEVDLLWWEVYFEVEPKVHLKVHLYPLSFSMVLVGITQWLLNMHVDWEKWRSRCVSLFA